MSNAESDLAAFIPQHSWPYDRNTDAYRRPPFASPVKAGKATALYGAHSYHTKVPPQGIEPYIRHYSEPGELILDPFCGSGMTGVAAISLQRNVILNDLSPAAAHIAYNYCTPLDLRAFRSEYQRVADSVKEEFEWLYGTTCDRCGGRASIVYTVWSDEYKCGRCGESIVLWEAAADPVQGTVAEVFRCPHCSKEWRKAQLEQIASVPVFVTYECQQCVPKRSTRAPSQRDLDQLREIDSTVIPNWYPREPLNPTWEMYIRGSLHRRGITRVDHFFTKRTLRALSRLWHEASLSSSSRIAEALRFAFTAVLITSTKMTRYNMGKRGNGPMSGLLYVPSLSVENNVGVTYGRKVDDIVRGLSELPDNDARGSYFGLNMSATALPAELSEAIDYVFTDPPFGQNLYYADLNFVAEAWLSRFTDRTYEAVVHREQSQEQMTIADYAHLMTLAFREMHRVLKPGRWASVVFHNSDDKIWQSIVDAADQAQLDLVEVNSFDKEQLTYKGVRGAKGIERVTNKDIVLNLQKPALHRPSASTDRGISSFSDAEERIVRRLAGFLETNPEPSERTLQHFWNVVLQEMIRNGAVSTSMEQVGQMLAHYFKQVDNRWYLRGEAVLGGNAFDLSTDSGALTWLNAILNAEPQTVGDLIPRWQAATAQVNDAPDRLERLLEQNFWLDKRTGRWRLPTDAEREQMTAAQDLGAQAHLRVIRKYLAGETDQRPPNVELAAWVRFAYSREAHREAVELYARVDEAQLDPAEVKTLRKMVAVCRIKAARTAGKAG